MMIMATNTFWQVKMGEITRNVVLGVTLWGLSIPLLILGHTNRDGIIVWSVLALFGIFLYWWFFRYLIPSAYTKRKPFRSYLEKVILLLAVAWLPMTLFITILMQGIDHALEISMM